MLLDIEMERDGEPVTVEVRLSFHPPVRGVKDPLGVPIEPNESAHWLFEFARGQDGRPIEFTEAEIARAEALALNEWGDL